MSTAEPRYGWREGHTVRLRSEQDDFFAAMRERVAAARKSVVLALYLAESGACLDSWNELLVAVARRGVDVFVLLDAFAAREWNTDALSAAGARVARYNPLRVARPRANLLRDHRKLLVVDGQTLFIGGYGFADEFDIGCTARPWHDAVFEITGPVVCDVVAELNDDWEHWAPARAPLPAPDPVAPGSVRVRYLSNHPKRVREIRHVAHRHMRSAQRRLWLSTAYFAPTRRLRRYLRQAARRGIDVRLLLAGPDTDQPVVRQAGRRYYGALLRAGVRVYEFPDRCLHLKAMVADDWMMAGSCNLDHWGMRWNRDANIECDDATVAAELAALIAADCEASVEITLAQYRARPWYKRLAERAAATVELTLKRLAYRRQLLLLRDHSLTPRAGSSGVAR